MEEWTLIIKIDRGASANPDAFNKTFEIFRECETIDECRLEYARIKNMYDEIGCSIIYATAYSANRAVPMVEASF